MSKDLGLGFEATMCYIYLDVDGDDEMLLRTL